MKSFIFPLTFVFAFLFSVLFTGCTGSSNDAAAQEEAPAMGESSEAGVRTAYEGSTGPKLLMERYKSGSIEGLND